MSTRLTRLTGLFHTLRSKRTGRRVPQESFTDEPPKEKCDIDLNKRWSGTAEVDTTYRGNSKNRDGGLWRKARTFQILNRKLALKKS